MQDLVLWPGIETRPPALGAQSLSLATRLPRKSWFCSFFLFIYLEKLKNKDFRVSEIEVLISVLETQIWLAGILTSLRVGGRLGTVHLPCPGGRGLHQHNYLTSPSPGVSPGHSFKLQWLWCLAGVGVSGLGQEVKTSLRLSLVSWVGSCLQTLISSWIPLLMPPTLKKVLLFSSHIPTPVGLFSPEEASICWALLEQMFCEATYSLWSIITPILQMRKTKAEWPAQNSRVVGW